MIFALIYIIMKDINPPTCVYTLEKYKLLTKEKKKIFFTF